MTEYHYIKRADVAERLTAAEMQKKLKEGSGSEAYFAMLCIINDITAADVVEVSVLKEFAKDVIYQFGYKVNRDNGRLYLTAGGLSTLETAFDILGWEDPRPFPEGECEWDGCYNYATCGTPTSDGYKRVCYKHLCEIEAEMNEERRESDETD